MITRLLWQPILICIFLVGCSSGVNSEEQMKMAINNMTMPFSSGAISLHIIPSAKMNAWNDIANSSVMLMLQANEKGILENVMNNPVIIKQMFDGAGSFDGILKIDRYVAMLVSKIQHYILIVVRILAMCVSFLVIILSLLSNICF